MSISADLSIVPMVDPEIGAALLEAESPAAFGARLLRAAQRVSSVEEVFACRGAHNGAPQTLVSSSERNDAAPRVREYERLFHGSDPLRWVRSATPPGQGFACAIAASQIKRRDYRDLCFDRPGFKEKLCFGWCSDEGWWALSFYRRIPEPATTPRLNALASIAMSLLAHRVSPRVRPEDDLTIRLERQLARAYPELTRRERQVCAGTLAGEQALVIANRLRVGVSTVLTYRQRAYRRLDVQSVGALLDRLIW